MNSYPKPTNQFHVEDPQIAIGDYLAPPSVTPFDAFYINETNERHITANSDWITLFQNETGPVQLYLQNQSLFDDRVYYASNNITAGNNVTTDLPQGDFIVKNNSNVVFKSGNNIVMKPGFIVEHGAKFHAMIIDEPLCSKSASSTKDIRDNSASYYNNQGDMKDIVFNIIKESDEDVTIFPNPTTGTFIITFNGYCETPINIEIFNPFGNSVFKKENIGRYAQIDLTSLSNGIYFIKIQANNKSYSKKLIYQ